ncbi:meiosis 1 arrest protein isoform X1 [Falco biarmicus]|uniref:meiosis 1 arrest protein isoform X1 n=1 Tax=Falco cherrug TaxID=345164 RepID=UPI000FFCBE0C|nr:meiosis 1 arrest protein isoform X1 [Falco cherrug]XP_055650668.1 meiosis 1 arrest protein isoform X1 [Falco peregrinus]XP_056201984.1 meiosis 1 arrest protein isoform X1 [Falco biarmicus]
MNSRKLLSEARRTFPATKVHCQQPARILIVDVTSPSQTNACSVLSEALENTLCLACALTGTCRVPLLSLYVVQNQQECLLPFTQVKENFARIQACISELRSLPREGCFPQRGHGVVQAVQDGLQQFKQYSRHTAAGSSTNSSVEITILTSQSSKEMVKQLEKKLKEIDLVSLRRIQVIEVLKRDFLEPEDAEQCMPAEEPSSNDVAILGMDIDVQTIEDNVISLEMLFKTWLHDYGTEREHLHLLLPSGGFSRATAPRTTLSISFSLPLCRELPHPTALKITQACPMGMFSHVPHPMCLKCDLQERLLDPALLSGTADGTMRAVDLNSPCQMAAWPATVLYKLQVVKALKSEGVCESVLYGLPFIIKPTTCWQLDWDELEINQHSFHALCHSLLKRKWMLLAKREPQNTSPNWNVMVHSYYIIIPSDSATLLVKAVAIRELLLPSTFPALLAEQPERVHGPIESALNSLEVEVAYNPLHLKSNLYKYLKSMLYKPLHRQQAQPRDQRPERHQPKQHQSRAKATVAPLLMAPSPAQVFRPPAVRRDSCERSLLPKEYDEFLQ